MYQLKTYRTEQGRKTVLVGEPGRKLMPILIMESKGLVVRKVPLAEERYLDDPPPFVRKKSMKTIALQFRAFGRRNGMTKAAKLFLTNLTKAA